MKLVLNKCYGGFGINDKVAKLLNIHPSDDDEEIRRNEELIALIEEHGSDYVSNFFSDLVVVEIPDTCTDYEIDEYDGYETVTYVVDGKLMHD